MTIRDVARAAGVSTATASRALHKSHLVAEDTRTMVRAAADRLHYSPHGAARSLITSRTHTIGVLLPDLYGEFFSEVIRGIDQSVQRVGYHCLLSSARHGGPPLEAALRAMRGRVDGLVLMSPEFSGELSRRTLPAGFPVILLNSAPAELPHGSLTVANFEGARSMVRHLAALGHRRIAILKGAEGNFDAAERLRGYRAALGQAGLEPAPELEIAGDFSESARRTALRARSSRIFTAVRSNAKPMPGSFSIRRAIRSSISTHFTGYRPVAVSPESMIPSACSKTAFATSVTSARVGRGFTIIDSRRWVATITGFPASTHDRTICL